MAGLHGGSRFLPDHHRIPVHIEAADLEVDGLIIGQGEGPLEVIVARSSNTPSVTQLRTVWNRRQGGRGIPLLVTVLYGAKAAVCGPAGEQPPVYRDVDALLVERLCDAALRQPSRHAALRFLYSMLPHINAPLPGIRNEGFLSLHELQYGVPRRRAFGEARERATAAIKERGLARLEALGFELEHIDNVAHLLLAGNRRRAVAVVLLPGEWPDIASERFNHLSPVSYALSVAERHNVPYVMLVSDTGLRLHPVKDGFGVAQRGRTETFVEVNLDLLSPEQAGYLWLLFSADALAEGGHFEDILSCARNHAIGVGARLRERIYDQVVPALAKALWKARGIQEPSAQDLSDTYEMALMILFRLLFIAYAEDKDLLPYRTNEEYQRRSLKETAQELLRAKRERRPVSRAASYWQEIRGLWHAIDEGRPEWGVPQYNGHLFSRDARVSRVGAELESITLPNDEFVPILQDLLIDEAPSEGFTGPVDFSALGVREFGTIYEGLLENELAIAETDLTTKRVGDQDVYWPVEKATRRGAEIVVRKGHAYLHTASGARKSTGSFYTPDFAVEHLLDHALEPALQAHIERLDRLDEHGAAEAFFDFRVADIAMGSGHFLVAAVDRIERRFSQYLAERRLPAVLDELARLRKAALQALKSGGEAVAVEDSQLLRRQIARRCVYGVDINPLAVQLARVSLWIHTFVPGLPLSFLDHNLVVGNSLVGIATIQEAQDELQRCAPDLVTAGAQAYRTESLFGGLAEALLGAAREPLERLARITDANASEIAAARKALSEAQEAVRPAQALFDILTAARLDTDLANRLHPAGGHDLVNEWLEEPARILTSREWKEAQALLGDLPPFHFPIAFPEVFLRNGDRSGFDCILGNPPWEKPKVEDKAFWGRHFPGYFSMTQREREQFKARIQKQRPDLVRELERELQAADLMRFALVSNPTFQLGDGDPDLFISFSWRFWHLLARDGYFGVVLPRQATMGKPAEHLRRTLLTQGTVSDLTFLLNRGQWVFPDQHPQYTIVLASVTKAAPSGAVPVRGPYTDRRRFEEGVRREPIRLPVDQVLSWTDAAALPLLPDDESGEIFLQLRKAPRLDLDDGVSWRARPYAELHSTNDKRLMDVRSKGCPAGYWRVYKGESFDIWQPDTGTYYAWANPEKVKRHLQEKRLRASRSAKSPFSEFPQEWLRDPETLPCLHPRIAFRDVTNRTNRRTVIAALVPPRVFLTEKSPYVLWPRGDERDQAYLLGVLSSIPLDWYSRRLVEGEMKYYLLNAFPVPRPGRDDPLWQRVVQLAGRLAAPDERFAKWAEKVGVEWGPLGDAEKEDTIAELDAVVAHLYGLTERQLVHIFETFHEGWDYTCRLQAVLGHFRQWRSRRG